MARCNSGLSVSYSYKKGCRCYDCREWKSSQTRRDPKAAERAKEWRKNNVERSRASVKKYQKEHPEMGLKRRLRNYGLTPEAFTVLEEQAKGLCMCCGLEQNGMTNPKTLHIDHDHATGKVRGLLCGACNIGLGHFNHETDRLLKAIRYLEEIENGDVE